MLLLTGALLIASAFSFNLYVGARERATQRETVTEETAV